MNKNLMSKMIKSNDINRGQYTYVYGGNGLADIVTRGGKQYTRNDVFVIHARKQSDALTPSTKMRSGEV